MPRVTDRQARELFPARGRSLGTFFIFHERDQAMLSWAITFLVIALIAALLGFGGIAGVAVEAAKIVFFVAIVLFVVSALVGVFRGRRTVP
jgi:uncharacterized membrane protein YtjA (UPF0391 family)